MNQQTISVSINSVARSVYAASALKSFMASTSDSLPPLLTPDNRAAMAEIIRTFAHIDIPDLLGHDCVVSSQANDDILAVSFMSSTTPSLSLVNTIESMMASRILSRLFSSLDKVYADAAENDAQRAAESVTKLLFVQAESSTDSIGDIPLAVTPTFY